MTVTELPPERVATTSLTLLAGFLGAGKTTVLNHLVRADHGARIGVLVNDFGEIDIDAELVASVDGETITLNNGCICCTIRDDLLLSLFRLLHRSDAPQHVIIEASGVSDPSSVLRSFGDASMFDIVRIASVVTVVDAEQFSSIEYRDRPLALHQLVVSDLVVLNKVDLVDEAGRAAVEAKIRETVPGARVIPAVRGRVPFDLVLGVGRFDPDRLLARAVVDVHVHEAGEPAEDHGLQFSRWAFRADRPLALEPLREALDRLPVSIYRAKGIVDLLEEPKRRVVVQVVGKRVELTPGEPWGDARRDSRLVAIGAAGAFDPAALTRDFEGSVATGPPGTGGLGGWIRRLWKRGPQ